jgi:hypothetical protein
MSNDLVASLFLFAFWLPPLAVVAGALALFVRVPKADARRSPVSIPAARLSH